ncbi:MAG: hypothetical protein KF693_02735 [Nitrospira sp.]|nr:hypothetical protein [Nitrospira sp.]
MRRRRLLPLSTVVSWLALVLCLGVTIDRVEDLAFEDTDVVDGINPASEEAENPDEHLLLRSVSTNGSAVKLVTLAPSVDGAMVSLSIQPATAWVRITSACHHPPTRSNPVSFTIPLRI